MIGSRWRVAVALAALAMGSGRASAGEPVRVRILSYNIHHGAGVDGKVDLGRLARVIRDADPDVVALQEVDRGVARSKKLDEPAELGRLAGMTPIFEKNIPYQGGEYGNAVLSKLPVRGHRNLALKSHYVGEQRGALVVDLVAPDGKTPFRLVATHLDFRPDDAERMDSVGQFADLARENPDLPTLLVGDLNARPDSRVLATLDARWARSVPADAPLPTFPVDAPTRQIDHVLFRPADRWKVVETRVLGEAVASDHRPLLVVLELAGG